MSKYLETFDLRIIFNKYKIKNISKRRINKYAENGSPCWACLSNLKCFVVFLPLMMEDFLFLKIALIRLTKSMPNQNFWRIWNNRQLKTESNAFSISTVSTASVGVFHITKISETTLSLSPINLFLTCTCLM